MSIRFCHFRLFLSSLIFVIFQPFDVMRILAIRVIIPMSPIRL